MESGNKRSGWSWVGWVPIAITVSALIAGCHIDAPLSDPADSEIDEHLLGQWLVSMQRPDTVERHAFIGRHSVPGGPKRLYELILVEYDASTHKIISSPEHTYMSMTSIGDSKYLNWYIPPQDGLDFSAKAGYRKWVNDTRRSCLLFRYEVDGDKIQLFPLDLHRAHKALGMKGEGWLLPVSSEMLHDLIERTGGKGLFSKEATVLQKAS